MLYTGSLVMWPFHTVFVVSYPDRSYNGIPFFCRGSFEPKGFLVFGVPNGYEDTVLLCTLQDRSMIEVLKEQFIRNI